MTYIKTEEQANEVAKLLVRVYELHETIISDTGGLPGLRDATSLHAAVARPFTTFEGNDLYQSDFEKAAALFHSLIKSHPFMDGTKRTAFMATIYFLETCGYHIPVQLPVQKVLNSVYLWPKKIYVNLLGKLSNPVVFPK
jgi:death-on-curing family protein